MKKLFVLLLALTVVGLAAYADDAAPAPALALSGYLNVGFVYTQVGSADSTIALNANDAGKQDRFNFAGKYDAGDYGVYFRYREQNTFSNSAPAVFVNRAYGWFKVLNMVTLKAGRLGTGTYNTGGDEDFGDWDTTPGFELSVAPVSGMSIGLMLPVSIAGSTTTYALPLTWFGAKYSMSGLGDFSVGFRGDSAAVWGWFNLTAIEKLTAYVEFQMDQFGSTAKGAKTLYEKVSYDMTPLTAGIALEQVLSNVSGTDTGMKFDPFVTYAMGNATLGLDVIYYMFGSKGGYEVDPNVAFALGKGTLKVGLGYNGGDISADDGTALSAATTKVYVDYVFNF